MFKAGGLTSVFGVANMVTGFRLILTPFFLWFITAGERSSALIVFIVAGATDVVDGYLARSRHQVTLLGQILDPVADKLLMVSAVFALWYLEYLPLWVPVLLLIKEIVLLGGGVIMYRHDLGVLSASVFGKLATFFLFSGVVLGVASVPESSFLIYGGVALSMVAGIDYLRQFLALWLISSSS